MSRAAQFTKTKIIGGAIFVLLLAAPVGIWLVNRPTEEPPKQQEVSAVVEEKTTDHITYQGEDGKTALELLKAREDVQTETSEFGELVTTINGQDGGGEKYWIFYVGGEMSSVGAGDYTTKTGETIEWKLQ